jgi:hypothetical protein
MKLGMYRKIKILAGEAATCFLLTGCLFGQNQQYFTGTTAPGSNSAGGISGVSSIAATPTPSSSVTPTPSSTPSPSSTPNGNAQPPVARNDGPFEDAENQTLTIATSDLLLNDTDPQSSPLRFVSFAQPTSGTITAGSNGTLLFQPATNFVGTVNFQYTIEDSLNLSASATVTINVRTPAALPMYAQTGTSLYQFDPSTNTSTLIANFRNSSGAQTSVFDIAITPAGLMYAVNGSGLYDVNAATAVLTLIPTDGISAFGNINGLTALSDQTLVISGNGVALYDIPTHTLSTLVAPGGYQSSGDIIALPDGNLYMSAVTSGTDHLIRINPTTGATTDVGNLNHDQVYGLGYANSTFYGFGADGEVFSINSTNASTTDLAATGLSWYGATTNPVLW